MYVCYMYVHRYVCIYLYYTYVHSLHVKRKVYMLLYNYQT